MTTLTQYFYTVRDNFILPAGLAFVVFCMVVVSPIGAVALGLGLCFVVTYWFRREWILAAMFVGLLLQNLVHLHAEKISPTLGTLVKGIDDVMLVFFVGALTLEAFLPVLKPERLPLWRSLSALILLCLLSAAANRLPVKWTAIGMYVLLKNFVWLYLAASIPMSEARFRRIFRCVLYILGAVMAFGYVQLATGGLTYDLLGLPRDYRLGILRVRSIFVRPVYFGEAMSLLAILSISAYIYLKKTRYLNLGIAALFITVMTMMLKSIGSLGFAVGFLVLRKRPLLIVPFALLGLWLMFTFSEYGAKNIELQYKLYIESPASIRREGYRVAAEIIGDSPLFGTGPGSFGGVAAGMVDSPVPYEYDFLNYDGQIYSTIDSHWPHVLGELGLLGFAAYCWFLWVAGRNSWRLSSRRDVSPYARILGATAAVFLLTVAIEAFAAPNLEDTLLGFMLFSLLGFTQFPPGETNEAPEDSTAPDAEAP